MDADEPTPEELARWEARDCRLAQWLSVCLCIAVAALFSLTGRWPSWSGDYPAFFARAAGYTVGLLLLPTILAAFVARSTTKWHYVFAGAFAVVLILVLLGRSFG